MAVKRLSRHSINVQMLIGFRQQVEILACLRHPNIIQFIGASFNNPANICIVFELMEGGDVHSLLHQHRRNDNMKNNSWSWYDPLCQIATDAARGLNYLHQASVIHRDFKCKNLLCSASFGCKVGDFGTSRRVDTSLHSIVGTPFWLSPEMLREEFYTIKSDCYSFGIVLLELETFGKNPYEDDLRMSPIEIMMQVAKGTLSPRIPSTCLPARRKLIEKCLSFHPDDRPDMTEVLDQLTHVIRNELDAEFQQQLQ